MARVEIPVTQITSAGVKPATQVVGSAENHFIPSNDGTLHLEAVNGSASVTGTVTILSTGSVGGVPAESTVITIPKSSEESGTRLIKVPQPQAVNQSNGQVFVNVSTTEVKFRCYRA